MSYEGYKEKKIKKLINEKDEINYGKSNSRSVLGSMNDLAFHYKYLVLDEGGVNCCDIQKIIFNLNRIPMSALKNCYPKDEFNYLINNST